MDTPTFRVITVQFAMPNDEPCYRLTTLRDEIQEHLYDSEGWAGSFTILGAVDVPDPGNVDEGDSAAASAFEDGDYGNGDNASDLILVEVAENIQRDKEDLVVLGEWAKLIARMGPLETKANEFEADQIMRRLIARNLLTQDPQKDAVTLTPQGFDAIGWC